VAAKVFDDLAERYRDRAGGYTRVLKLRSRRGDAAPLSLVELVEPGAPAAQEKPAKKKAAAKKTAKAASKKTTAKKTTRKKKAEN
jgi:large subunit ribosomal protein L17